MFENTLIHTFHVSSSGTRSIFAKILSPLLQAALQVPTQFRTHPPLKAPNQARLHPNQSSGKPEKYHTRKQNCGQKRTACYSSKPVQSRVSMLNKRSLMHHAIYWKRSGKGSSTTTGYVFLYTLQPSWLFLCIHLY